MTKKFYKIVYTSLVLILYSVLAFCQDDTLHIKILIGDNEFEIMEITGFETDSSHAINSTVEIIGPTFYKCVPFARTESLKIEDVSEPGKFYYKYRDSSCIYYSYKLINKSDFYALCDLKINDIKVLINKDNANIESIDVNQYAGLNLITTMRTESLKDRNSPLFKNKRMKRQILNNGGYLELDINTSDKTINIGILCSGWKQ